MNLGQVLIVSDDSEFVHSLVADWQTERDSPAITAVAIDACRQACVFGYELLVVGPLHQGMPLQAALSVPAGPMVCAVGDPSSLNAIRARHGDWVFLAESPGWTMTLFFLAREISRRTVAEARVRETEAAAQLQRRLGALGSSLLEARPWMINALTSLIGNADLLLLADEPLPANCREHVRVIQTMAQRLNETVQRLTSIENDFDLNQRESQVETPEMRMVKMSED